MLTAKIRMDPETEHTPRAEEAQPGMVFDWCGQPYLIVDVDHNILHKPRQDGKVHGMNLKTGRVSWLWNTDKVMHARPTFVGYATGIEITVQREEPS